MIAAVVEWLQVNRRAEVTLAAADYEAFAGCTQRPDAQPGPPDARPGRDRGRSSDGRGPRPLVDLKAQVIRNDSLLEYFPVADNAVQLGGFAGLQRWLRRARLAFSPQAAALNLPAPKGIMIVGVQGCGKSLAAKVIAREWQMPLLKLDAGRLYDKYVGESEKNLRHALAHRRVDVAGGVVDRRDREGHGA